MMELLKKLTGVCAPSGNEEELCRVIFKEAENYADEIYKDALGNLIVHKKGSGKKVMFAAHTDEIGVIVTHIDDNGFLRFAALGGVDAHFALYQRVQFPNGVAGVVGYEETLKEMKDLALSKLYIDIGAASKKDAEDRVRIGDAACFCGAYFEQNGKVVSKALDNRAGVFVLLAALKTVGNTENDLYFVFTAQEELGLRGARAAAFDIAPDFAVAVDVTDTGDTPECNPMAVKLGGGPAIKVMDSSILTSKAVRETLVSCAKEHNIPYQLEVLVSGGTDAGAIHQTGAGVRTGAVSIPTRYIHSVCEMADINDITNAVKLIAHAAQKF